MTLNIPLEEALAALTAAAEPDRVEQMVAYHKQSRPVLGVPNTALNDITKAWRQDLSLADRLSLADELWKTDIFEARIAAAKLLTQARIKEDTEVWNLLQSWLPDFDGWAIADHACMAAQKRLVADPARLDDVETWTTSDHIWTRRAALVACLPWAKLNHLKPEDQARRDRILGWAASYVPDRNWFIQKSIAWWIRDLSKHDAEASHSFLAQHGDAMKPFARKEAGKYLKTPVAAKPADQNASPENL
ncbi:DNA alkylation repair enzyme [Phaeobacter sp. CECT 5382]|uniref:DNA alkylation repair protein n=1 Tax=Phaeobacter sp. CECT 5382 TaxID=1712645 RepID=UPI0006DA7DAE|nr:DNA alkylation repair protein [Phaeobacter sp. CECT 5382]CUH86383.1 DNA alkylation repair enzyme [Phaeobacter sp. CECT 5382]